MLKVIQTGSSFAVVSAGYGQVRDGFTYEPIPVCRVGMGHGRSEAQARQLAERIAALVIADDVCRGLIQEKP